jgi:hypothetical protein
VAQGLGDGDAGGMGEGLKDFGFELAERVLHAIYYIRKCACACESN